MKVYEVEFHYGRQTYEFLSDLDLEVGSTYRITDDSGHTYRNRVLVVGESDVAVYSGALKEIVEATEVDPW